MSNAKFTIQPPREVVDALDTWVASNPNIRSRNELINRILEEAVKEAQERGDIPQLINAEVVTEEHRQLLDKVITLVAETSNIPRAEAIQLLLHVQEKNKKSN